MVEERRRSWSFESISIWLSPGFVTHPQSHVSALNLFSVWITNARVHAKVGQIEIDYNLSVCKHLVKSVLDIISRKRSLVVDSKSNVNRFVLRYTQHFLFFYLCFCSVLLIFSSFSDVLGSCLWSLSWSDFSFLSLSLSRPGEIRIQFHSLISGFGIRSQSGSYNRASLCFYWWSGEHWTLKSMFRHWFSISLSLFFFCKECHQIHCSHIIPAVSPRKIKKYIFSTMHFAYILAMP